jgi:two-component system OmpR family response regulator
VRELWRWDVILSEVADQLSVLLVEDDRAVAEIYRYKLELDGYAVSVAGGETAIAVAKESPPDLIFLEVQVPNLDAALALERLRLDDCTRDVPVVFLTEHQDVELLRHGFVLGPLDHVIDTSTLTEWARGPRNEPNLQVVPGSEPLEGSSLMNGYFSVESFGS